MKHFSEIIEDGEGNDVTSYTHFMSLQNNIIPKLKDELEAYQTNFENIFCLARSLHDMNTFVQLKTNIRNIKETQSSLDKSLRQYQAILDNNPLLNTYSRYMSSLYRAMTVLCKLVDEPVYTWRMFLRIIDDIIAKKKREQMKRETEESEEGESDEEKSIKHLQEFKQKLGMADKEVELNFDLFYTEIIPSIYAVVCASYSTENVSLLNLLFALEIGNLRGSFQREEQEFFLESLCKFKNYKDWRKPETSFIRLTTKIDKGEYNRLRRHLNKLYPSHKDLFEKINDYVITYKDMMNLIFKNESKSETLMEDINIRFLCPDDEFRSKI